MDLKYQIALIRLSEARSVIDELRIRLIPGIVAGLGSSGGSKLDKLYNELGLKLKGIENCIDLLNDKPIQIKCAGLDSKLLNNGWKNE